MLSISLSVCICMYLYLSLCLSPSSYSIDLSFLLSLLSHSPPSGHKLSLNLLFEEIKDNNIPFFLICSAFFIAFSFNFLSQLTTSVKYSKDMKGRSKKRVNTAGKHAAKIQNIGCSFQFHISRQTNHILSVENMSTFSTPP